MRRIIGSQFILTSSYFYKSLSRFFSSKNAFITPLPFNEPCNERSLAPVIGVRKIEVPSSVTTNLVPGWMPSLLRKSAGMVMYPLLFIRTSMSSRPILIQPHLDPVLLPQFIQTDQPAPRHQIPMLPAVAGSVLHVMTPRLVDAAHESIRRAQAGIRLDDRGPLFVFCEK